MTGWKKLYIFLKKTTQALFWWFYYCYSSARCMSHEQFNSIQLYPFTQVHRYTDTDAGTNTWLMPSDHINTYICLFKLQIELNWIELNQFPSNNNDISLIMFYHCVFVIIFWVFFKSFDSLFIIHFIIYKKDEEKRILGFC